MFNRNCLQKSKEVYKIAKVRRNFIATTTKKHPHKYRKNTKCSKNSDLKKKVKGPLEACKFRKNDKQQQNTPTNMAKIYQAVES